jgi:hypothetical protein
MMSEKVKRKKRGAIEETTKTTSIKAGVVKALKFESKKDRFMVHFPLVGEEGSPRIKTVGGFGVKFGMGLSDGKFHQFQYPDDDAVYDACLACPALEEVEVKFTLVAVYDSAKPKKGAGYEFAYLKLTNNRLKQINELLEELSDDDIESIQDVDIAIKLSTEDNALQFQSMNFLAKGESLLMNGNADTKTKDYLKEAESVWSDLEDKVMAIEDDDTILALLDIDDNEGKKKKKKGRKAKTKDKAKKKKFSKKDMD